MNKNDDKNIHKNEEVLETSNDDGIIENSLDFENSVEINKEDVEGVVDGELEDDSVNDSKSDSKSEDNDTEYTQGSDTEYTNEKKNNGLLKFGVLALVSSVLGSATTMFVMKDMVGQATSNPIVVGDVDTKGMQGLNVYQAVAKKASPSVVGIMTTSISTNNIFSMPVENSGIGTGVIVDSRGYVLTNAHVVSAEGEKNIKVVLSDGKNVEGKVLWQDASLDLAIVKIEGNGYMAAELGDSDKVTVGDIAIAIGNPIGLEYQATVTQGIISGVNRSVEGSNFAMEGLIQTDASINPGNSGGPLLNKKGQVVGINTAKTANAEGIGFAIPINIAKPIVEQVIKTGSFEKVMLGIKGMALSTFESLVGADLEADKGVYVVEVQENTPAKIAGIKTGDVIVSINGTKVSDMNSLAKELYKIKFGETCEVIVNRSGEDVVLKVKFKKN